MADESGMLSPAWHTLGAEDVLRRLEVDPQRGLDDEQVQARQGKYGRNELEESPGRPPLAILLDQFKETMVIVLIVAAIISAVLGEGKDAAVIMVIVVLNAVLGFTQEYRAEQAMAALKKMSNPVVKVRRSGAVQQRPGRSTGAGRHHLARGRRLDPRGRPTGRRGEPAGAGGRADGRIDARRQGPRRHICRRRPVGDRHNMVFMGTAVTLGRGAAVVVETGMRTQLGHIAHMIQTRGGREDAAPAADGTARHGAGSRRARHRRGGLWPWPAAGRRDRAPVPHLRRHGGRGGARGPARGGHDRAGARRAAHAQAQGPDPQAARGRDARLGHDDLLG